MYHNYAKDVQKYSLLCLTCSGGVSGYSNGLFLQSGEELCFKLVSVVAAAVLFACAAAGGEVM